MVRYKLRKHILDFLKKGLVIFFWFWLKMPVILHLFEEIALFFRYRFWRPNIEVYQ